METTTAWIGSLVPLHEPHDAAKMSALTESMVEHGWNGRPILVIDNGNGYLALTGSHRIAAARAAGLDEIPVYAIDGTCHILTDNGDCTICGKTCWIAAAVEARDDYDREEAIEMSGDPDAIALMAAEME